MDVREYEPLLTEAEKRLDRLKALYEQWFQGIERIEPTVVRKDFDRRLAVLRKEQPRNTGLRFRLQQLIQRYTTYGNYWRRVSRQIEEGTFRRDLSRVRKRREPVDTNHEPSLSPEPASPPPPPARDGNGAPRARPASPARGTTPPSLPPVVRSLDVSEAELQRLYRQFIAARRRNQERVDNIRYDKLARTVRDMLPKLEQKHGGRPIQFEVVVKDGRVGIKPVPK